METALHIALFLASASVIVMVAALIPAMLGKRKHQAESKTGVKLFAQDSRAMVQNVNKLTTQAQAQIDDVDRSLRLIRGWVDRADRLSYPAGDLIVGPLFTGARTLNGLAYLLQAWLAEDKATSRIN
jgi:hypothetical protein